MCNGKGKGEECIVGAFLAFTLTECGYLRFQAQYLRRLRVPYWRDVPAALRADLTVAGTSRNVDACSAAAAALYKLAPNEQQTLAAQTEVINAA